MAAPTGVAALTEGADRTAGADLTAGTDLADLPPGALRAALTHVPEAELPAVTALFVDASYTTPRVVTGSV